jgi:hypothetical protein
VQPEQEVIAGQTAVGCVLLRDRMLHQVQVAGSPGSKRGLDQAIPPGLARKAQCPVGVLGCPANQSIAAPFVRA